MGLKLNHDGISPALSELQQIIHSEIIRTLQYIGEQCVIEARDRPPEASWNDITGNLRSSIGYAICHNGQIILQTGFKKVKPESTEGELQGLDLIRKVADAHKEYQLIVVAGMYYAVYVEHVHNKVVLSSAKQLAQSKTSEYFTRMVKRIIDKVNNKR